MTMSARTTATAPSPTHVTYGVGRRQPRSVAVGLIWTVTGILDLAVANSFGGASRSYLNNGDGTFAEDVTYGAGDAGAGVRPVAVTTGDLDGDGDLDLAVTGSIDRSATTLYRPARTTATAPSRRT